MATANWAQEDQRRMLHAVYRVGDLQKTVDSYREQFGMQLLEKLTSQMRNSLLPSWDTEAKKITLQ